MHAVANEYIKPWLIILQTQGLDISLHSINIWAKWPFKKEPVIRWHFPSESQNCTCALEASVTPSLDSDMLVLLCKEIGYTAQIYVGSVHNNQCLFNLQTHLAVRNVSDQSCISLLIDETWPHIPCWLNLVYQLSQCCQLLYLILILALNSATPVISLGRGGQREERDAGVQLRG